MIIIHEGIPGAGKSYDAVRKILDALKIGRIVHTNIDGLNQDKCLEYIATWCDLSRDELSNRLFFIDKATILQFWEYIEPGCLVVIDEAQLYFNSRDFTKQSNREIADWASTHRHYGYDVIFITQRAERIDTAVRSLADFKYRYRKLNFMGPVAGYMVYTFIGDDERHISFQKRSYDKAIFPAYNSYVGNASEKVFHKVPNIFKHPVFLAIPVCFAAMVYFGMSGNLFSDPLDISGKKEEKKPSSIAALVAPSVQATDSNGQRPTAPAEPPPVSVAPLVPADEILLFPVSAYIKTDDKTAVMVDGVILYAWEHIDENNLVVGVKRSRLPAALVLKIKQQRASEIPLYDSKDQPQTVSL